jgi:hypothetical protein
MKNVILTLLFSLFLGGLFAQTAKVSGTIISGETKTPVQNAIVKVGDLQSTSNDKGYFEIVNVPFGKAKISVEAAGNPKFEQAINVDKEDLILGDLDVAGTLEDDTETVDDNIVSSDFLDEGDGGTNPSLLSSSSDVYSRIAGFTFGKLFFRTRGYDNSYQAIYLNGVSVENPEMGRTSWSVWGGLNDVTRNKDTKSAVSSSEFGFGDIGGATNISTQPSTYRKTSKVSYAMGNTSYRQRIMATYATGLMKNGWAFMFSGSRRWANEGYVEGTYYDGWSYFGAAERKLNDKHSLVLSALGTPTERGMQAASTQEAYDLAGTNYYNPNWGYQNGEKRNARTRFVHQPLITANHIFKPSEKTKITTALAYSFGTFSNKALNWYNAYDPRPDYYRLLPSYVELYGPNPVLKTYLDSVWQNDESIRQVNWDAMYYANYLSYYNYGENNGRAKYMIEDRRDDHKRYNISSNINHNINESISLAGGFEISRYKVNHYKLIDDFLEYEDMEGKYYWIDVDQFAERDFPGNDSITQNDLDNPNRVCYEGDRFGYDYDIHVNSEDVWGQSKFVYDNAEFYVGANLVHTDFWRVGNMKNGRAPENSLGESEHKTFLDFGVKAGATLKLSGHHYFIVNGLYRTNAPSPKVSFLSPRVKNEYVDSLISEKIYTADIAYVIKYRKLNAKITAYNTIMLDKATLMSFYHDELKSFASYSMRNVDTRNQGIEFGAEIKATDKFSFLLAGSYSDNRYISRPTATVSVENGSLPDSTKTIYLNNYYLPGAQAIGSFGLKYNINYWFFNANVNYVGKSYLSMFPELRSEAAINGTAWDESIYKEKIQEIIDMEKFKDGITLDLSIGKSIRIDYKYFINVNFSVSNILNNTSLKTGGYESLRFDFATKNLDKFDSKYYYSFGRTFYLNVSFRI